MGRSMSILEPGDKFRFRGLRGGAHDHDDNGEYELTIEVLYISMTGQLTVRTRNEQFANFNDYNIPYDLAVRMIDERIWEEKR